MANLIDRIGDISILPMGWIMLITVAAMLVLTAVCLLLRRGLGRLMTEADRGVAGNYFSMAGTFTALLLALLTVMVHEEYNGARAAASAEANAVGDLFLFIQSVDDPREGEIEQRIEDYTRAVIDEEWAALARGESSPRAWRLFYDIGVMIDDLEPETRREQQLYAQMLDGFAIMADQRRDRLSKAGTTLPAVMWAMLFVSILITMSYAVAMGGGTSPVSAAMLCVLAVLIGLVLSVMVAMNSPFGGGLGVQPSDMTALLAEFDIMVSR
jgi:NADH:ubiquinone oxidoreductase subunit 6 (subunit J)